ncbi:hypothetical protein KM043_016584 [Ampulex compressa]|nr:hypothetical protein KM043_016584 [Ampulex compressa]
MHVGGWAHYATWYGALARCLVDHCLDKELRIRTYAQAVGFWKQDVIKGYRDFSLALILPRDLSTLSCQTWAKL